MGMRTEPGTTTGPPALLRPFMPELDTLRGIAVSGVVLVHAFSWQYSRLWFGEWAGRLLLLTEPGWIGVNLFFVLSGFLITGILLDSKAKPYFYRRFYTRRVLRILPAYYLLLILLLVLHSSSLAFAGLSFLYLANVTSFFGVTSAYGPLWSLAVEEHFYILWPMIVRNLSGRKVAWVAGVIVVIVPVARAIAFALGYRNGLDWYTWFVADGLALGAMLAVGLRTGVTRSCAGKWCGALFAFAIVAAMAGLPFGLGTRNRLLGAALQLSIVNIFFAGLLLAFLILGTGPVKTYINLKPLRFLGYISYGLYLDHLLIFRLYDRACLKYWSGLMPCRGHFELVVLRFLVGGTVAVAAAYFSRRFFEEPFLRLKETLAWGDRPAERSGVAMAGSIQAA
jgi:peptidoglycan/LPS O-acetylase OafA/YrhL